ncbi:hypothetical protein IGI04_014768 [Brassica rapa subsp. trilocularis]|uniref:Uncharacterized protein n=1 Tax=Brassica rapa subsp. trilocularis TaxID=1813537 RepID=A0ABQ7MR76_BRACM|nr:hypothetical protein IGI04_014768 [Brassica rapa subsp. trilocularis]
MSYPLELDQSCLIKDRELATSKNEIFSDLEPLDRAGGLGGAGDGGSNGGNVVMWVFPCQRLCEE